MDTTVSVCGLDCAECDAYPATCPGCRASEGEPPWLMEVEMVVCPMYQCPVMDKNLEDCGECSELPCELYREFRDPAVPPERHEAGIAQRVARLKEPAR